MQETTVIIVGAGPSGLATAACLGLLSIPSIVLEREDCSASIWKKSAYDRLHLHIPKQFCELPHMPLPLAGPNYTPKDQFINYLDDYASRFDISPMFMRSVDSAEYDDHSRRWIVRARNLSSGEREEYSGRFLVVASGESTDPYVPEVDGLKTFPGRVLHSTRYRSGKEFKDEEVLVVGSGNSGMEIALDLSDHGAKTSIVVRSPVHVLTRGMVHLGLVLLNHNIPVERVDSLMEILSKQVYGDLSKYGIKSPKEGPFLMKVAYGKYPVFDMGTCKKIKSGKIQVLPGITSISGNVVLFENGESHPFDSIIFATGFKRSTVKWLKVKNKNYQAHQTWIIAKKHLEEKDDARLLGEDGIPTISFPNHWKGKNGLYCIGLSRRGLYGINADAKNTANDIKSVLSCS